MLLNTIFKRVVILILSGAMACSALVAMAAERNVVIDAVQSGPYAVGSTNFSVSASKIIGLSAEGLDDGKVMGGVVHNGSTRYVGELLTNPSAAFSFDLDVPNDTQRYDASAGSKLPFYGIVLYPTTADNARADYQFFAGSVLPHMQTGSDAPLFADEAERYPLLVYSHGVGGFPQKTDLEYLKVLASHGYVVVGLFHGDNRFGTTEPRQFSLRSLAVKVALDTLLADAAFVGHIDSNRIGGLGRSFGGATMLSLLGAKRVNPDAISVFTNSLLETTVDPRIVAAATIVPYAGKDLYSLFGSGGGGAASVDRPFMINIGNADEATDYSKVQAVAEQIPGTKYLVQYEGEKHEMSTEATNDAFAWMKVFLDANVKKDVAAVDLLSRVGSASGAGSDTLVAVTEPSITAKYPEFSNQQITIDGVHVGADRYDVTLTLVSESPIVFTLIGAVDSDQTSLTTGFFANNVLTIPRVIVNGAPFSVTMELSNENPIQFTLTKADEIVAQ